MAEDPPHPPEWPSYDSFIDDYDLSDMLAVSPLAPRFAPGSLDPSHHATASTGSATFSNTAGPAGAEGASASAESYGAVQQRLGQTRPSAASAQASSSGASVAASTTAGSDRHPSRSSAYHEPPSPTPAQFDWSPTNNNPHPFQFTSAGTTGGLDYSGVDHLRQPFNAQFLDDLISPVDIHHHHHHINPHFNAPSATAPDYPNPWTQGSDAGLLHTGLHVPDIQQQQSTWLDPASTGGQLSPLSGNWDEPGEPGPKSKTAASGAPDDGEPLDPSSAPSRRKRAKKGPSIAGTSSSSTGPSSRAESLHERKSSVATAESASGTSSETLSSTTGKGAGKLRTAPRTVKTQTRHKPPTSPEERRTRASHNLVEKQYRNRLNAQFESLLSALPEHVRQSAGTAGVGPEAEAEEADDNNDDNGDESQQAGSAPNSDRRLSKAEVLELARRHIVSLEREREVMQREKAELLGRLELMQASGGDDGKTDVDAAGASKSGSRSSSREAARGRRPEQQGQERRGSGN